MKKVINRWLVAVWVYKYVISTLWMHVNGRWYVFRDTPDLAVQYIASKKIGENDNMDYISYVMQARMELKLRESKKK